MLERTILKDIVDLHIHAGPSLAKRSVDAAEALKEAMEAGYKAIVIKDHYFPTMMGCTMVEKHLGDGRTKCFGGIALNNSIGGLNLNAIDAAVGMGAKIVWLPTMSAKNHHDTHKQGFIGAGSGSVVDEPICYLDENGNLTPQIVAVLEYMAGHKEVILATGHGSAREIDAMILKAHELGIEKILVDHPFFQIGATVEDCKRWAELGATIEMTVCVFENTVNIKTGTGKGPIPFSVFKEYFDAIPIDRLLIDSDLGQSIFHSPVTGIFEFLNEIHDRFGVTEEQIEIMAKKNPARLLGLE